MTISFTHSQTETRMNRCINKIPISLRPDKEEFVRNAINNYIDELLKQRVVSNV